MPPNGVKSLSLLIALLLASLWLSHLALVSARPLSASAAVGGNAELVGVKYVRETRRSDEEPSAEEEDAAGDGESEDTIGKNQGPTAGSNRAVDEGGFVSTQEGAEDSRLLGEDEDGGHVDGDQAADGAAFGAGGGLLPLPAVQEFRINTFPSLLRNDPPITLSGRLEPTKSWQDTVTRTFHTEFQDDPQTVPEDEQNGLDPEVVFPGQGDIDPIDASLTPVWMLLANIPLL